MKKKMYKGIPYSLWNPFTDMDQFRDFLGFGPVVITRGEGPYVFDDKGRKLINGFSSLWNVSVGHGRKELVDAATQQMKELAFASCFRQTHPRAIELADKLVQISPEQYQYVNLGTNGSEAVETALKIIRQYFRQSSRADEQGRYKVISLKHCYHGVSYGAMSTSGLEEKIEEEGAARIAAFIMEPIMGAIGYITPPEAYYGEVGRICRK